MAEKSNSGDTMITRNQWDSLYTGVKPHTAPQRDQLRKWLERYVPPSSGSCLEIGCFPGRYLSVIGRLGYQLYGVDLAEKLPLLESWLKQNDYHTGTFWHEDFFSFDPGIKFDLVMSLGFIEHYRNWEEVLRRHFHLVREGGMIILEAPNFPGTVQKLIHRHLDRKNFEQHFLEAMDPDRWCQVLRESGFEIIFSGYTGKFDFWVQEEERGTLSRFILRLLRCVRPAASLLPGGKKSYSPYAVVLARKAENNPASG